MNKATTDDEPGLFVSTIKAMGFQVELCGPTHRSGNMIDLMSIQSGCHIGDTRNAMWTLPFRPL